MKTCYDCRYKKENYLPTAKISHVLCTHKGDGYNPPKPIEVPMYCASGCAFYDEKLKGDK